MKNIFLLVILINSILFAYKDLGTYGNTHLINEKSFDVLLEERYNEKVKKEKILEEINNAYEKSFTINSSLRNCEETKQREYIPELIISEDIKLPYSDEILFKKGYKYNILTENNIFFNKYLIFIDSNDKTQVNLARTYRKYSNIYVVNGDIKKLLKDNLNVFQAREKIEVKMLDVKCTPTILTQQNDKFIINEYNPNDLIKEQQ